jgi:hypothetical protein
MTAMGKVIQAAIIIKKGMLSGPDNFIYFLYNKKQFSEHFMEGSINKLSKLVSDNTPDHLFELHVQI